VRQNHATTRYYESQVTTSSPEKLVVMLYEAAIRSLTQSISHVENGNPNGKRDSVDKALAIIQQLQTTLDMEKGGHIAAQLERLYGYITSRILDGSANLDKRPLEEAVRLLTTLHSAWATVASAEFRTTPEPTKLQAVEA
jgi:flagellar protein FliS